MAPDSELESILKLWTDFNSSLNPEEIYQKACKAAIDILGADHSTFVHFDSLYQTGNVCAEAFNKTLAVIPGVRRAKDMKLPLEGIVEEKPLFETDGYIQFDDVAGLPDGKFKSNLSWLGVKSVLIVPVRWKDRVFGSFSFDSMQRQRVFQQRDLQLMKLIAEAIAQALGNAQIYGRERYRSQLLARLDATRSQLKSVGSEMHLRTKILEGALWLSQWTAGATFRYSGDQNQLHLVARSTYLEEQKLPENSELTITADSWIWQEMFEQKNRSARVFSRAEHPEIFERDSLLQPFRRAVILTITRFEDIDSAVLLLDQAPERAWEQDELEYLLEFSSRVTTAIERQSWWDEVGDTLAQQFSVLFSTSPRDEADIDRLLYHFLTMVTAGFGLKFNRATVFLLNETRDKLEPRFAIGQFAKGDWLERCKLDGATGADQFEKWLDQPYDTHPATEMELWARSERAFNLEKDENALLKEALGCSHILLKDAAQLNSLPSRLREKLQPTSPVAVSNLHDGVEPIGVLIVDKEWTERHIGAKDLHLLQIFCKEAARRIASYWQRKRIPELNEKFERVSNIKNRPDFASLEESQILEAIIAEVSAGLANANVGILFTNQNGVTISRFQNPPVWMYSIDPFDREGIGRRVVETGFMEVIEVDQLPPKLREQGVRGMTFLPFLRESKAVGVIVALHHHPLTVRRLDDSTLQRYANVASEVYTWWSTVHFLRTLQGTIEEITIQSAHGKASLQMVKAAQRLFDAKTVTFWPYDARKGQFQPEPERLGFDDRLPQPSPNGLTNRILHELGYYPIGDVQSSRQDLHPKTVEFLEKYHQHSVQGIAIGSPQGRLGVLYLSYGEPRDFTLGAQIKLESFARNVAIVLESARALHASQQVLEATEEVSRVLARGNKQQTLYSLAARALDSIRCHSVTIFSLDRYGDPDFPPVIAGADQSAVEREDREDATRLVRALIIKGQMVVARDVEQVKRIFSSKFADREDIHTTFAIPMRFHNIDVGVMFASFRKELPDDDVGAIGNLVSLFANQAAVAIGNANRFRDLGELSAKLLRHGEAEGVLNIAADFVESELRPSHCVFVLREGAQLRAIVQRGWTGNKLFQEIVEEESHAAYTISRKEPNRFSTMQEARQAFNPPDRLVKVGVESGIGVPLFSSENITGALVLHAQEQNRFEEEDVSYASLIANEAMTALRSITMLRRVRAQYNVAKIAAEYGPTTKPDEILERVAKVCLESLVDGANKPKAVTISIEIWNPAIGSKTARMHSVEPSPAINEPLMDGREHIGQMEIWTEQNRALDNDDIQSVQSIGALLVMFARQVREQQRVLSNLATAIHEYERIEQSLSYVNMMLDPDLTKLTEHQRERMTSLKDALLRFDDHHRRITHTVHVLAGTLHVSRKRVEIARVYQLLYDCTDRFHDAAIIRNVTIVLPVNDSAEPSGFVDIDESLLLTVFTNLIGNAMKFSAAGDTVTCAITTRKNELVVEIADEGPGILNPLTRERIFEVFVQADEHKSYQAKGFGVGLFISKNIIQLHGGKIEVTSPIARGRGAKFSVSLPVFP